MNSVGRWRLRARCYLSTTVAVARAAMPSRRPVKPRPSVVVALTPTRPTSMPRIAAMRRAHGVAVGRDLRGLAQERHVDIGDAAAPARTRRAASARKMCEAAPFQRGSLSGKMLADVAVADGAEQGVGQRVQGDVGVGMAFERVGVGDAHAAQPDMIAGREAVHVEALAGAHVAAGAACDWLGHGEVLRRGELAVGVAAGHQRDGRPAHSATAASSVKSKRPAAAAARARRGWRRSGSPAASARATGPRGRRCRRQCGRRPARFSVSATGTAAMAPGCLSSAAMTRGR